MEFDIFGVIHLGDITLKTIHKAYPSGAEAWYYKDNGKIFFHREDGPAYIHNGVKEWHFNGMYHRIDGPAYIIGDIKEYWINDIEITMEVEKWMKENDISYPFDEEETTLFKLRFYKGPE